MAQSDSTVTTIQTESGLEFRASGRNEHGTGYDIIVSTPFEGHVEILIYQVICHEVPVDPQISLLVPVHQAEGILQVIHGGAAVAHHMARNKRCH